MKIEFDDIIFSLQKTGGASTYWREVTSRLAARDSNQITRTRTSRYSRGLPVISSADVFHSSHFRYSVFSPAKNVTTAHDLIYERGLASTGIGATLNTYERKVSYHTADAIICISEHTKKDLLAVYPKLEGRCPIYVIYHGLTRSGDNVLLKCHPLACGSPYILYVGGRGGYKNFSGALEGYRLSGVWREGIKLVCTGRQFDDAERAMFTRLGLSKMVLLEENVNENRLYELYRNAFCLLYTSRYEGFGLPPLEAMSCGCPVVASNVSSIPEVVGDAGILIDPDDTEKVAGAIHRLSEPLLRQRFIDAGYSRSLLFSWDKSADEHQRVYQNVAKL